MIRRRQRGVAVLEPGVTSTRAPVRVLGVPVHVVGLEDAVERIVGMVASGSVPGGEGSGVVVTLNPEILMRARRERELAAALEHAALVVPDGIGLVLALRRRGHEVATRVAGVDLLDAYLARAAAQGHRVALCGARPGVAALAAERYRQRYPGLVIAATDSGPPERETARRLAESQPDVVAAAYGGGKQELFLARHLAEIGAAAGIGVGGTLDFVAGRRRRAPKRVQAAGLEWAWRLAQEPSRIGRQFSLPAFWWQERAEAVELRRGRSC